MTGALTLRNKLFAALALVLITALVAFTVINLTAAVPAQAATDSKPDKKTINVTGQGVVYASPDIAYITLGVVTENKDAKVAQQDNAKAMDKVIAMIKSAGVKSEDIKTMNYSIYPKYDYNQTSGVSQIIGYQVTNSVQVTVRDLSKTGTILDLAADSGSNVSSGISFGLSDNEKFYNEALKKAVEAGKKRAQTMAGALGVTLKSPITVTESGGFTPPIMYGGYDMVAKAEGAPSTPVQSGTLEIRANVSIVYEY